VPHAPLLIEPADIASRGGAGRISLEDLDDDSRLQQFFTYDAEGRDKEPQDVPPPRHGNSNEAEPDDGETKAAHPAQGVALAQETVTPGKTEPEPLGQERETGQRECRGRIDPPLRVEDRCDVHGFQLPANVVTTTIVVRLGQINDLRGKRNGELPAQPVPKAVSKAVGNGANPDVFVADTDNHRIQKFTSDGGFVTKWDVFGNA
jgi:hypothetical protein